MIEACNRIKCDAKDRASVENCRCGIMDAYEQGRKDVFPVISEACKYRAFTFYEDNKCEGYMYCQLKGFKCECNFKNCELMKEQKDD